MRLPFLQVTQGAFIGAAVVANLLDADEDQILGKLLRLWRWALSTGPEDQPPNGVAKTEDPARYLAAIIGWKGDQASCLRRAEAFESAGFIELGADFLRVRGLDRYASAWERQSKERARKADWRAKKDAERAAAQRVPGTSAGQARDKRGTNTGRPAAVPGTSPDKMGKTQTQTQTQTQIEEHDPDPKEEAATTSAGLAEDQGFALEAPKPGPKPRKKPPAIACFEFFAELRSATLPESPDTVWTAPKIQKHWADVSKRLDTKAKAEPVIRAFLADPKKRALSPPAPAWAFVKDWPAYLTRAPEAPASKPYTPGENLYPDFDPETGR